VGYHYAVNDIIMDKEPHQSFTDLDVWKKAREFKKQIEALSKAFPPEEKYRLCGLPVLLTQTLRRGMAGLHLKINCIFAYRQGAH
jgi:hypothetical protein